MEVPDGGMKGLQILRKYYETVTLVAILGAALYIYRGAFAGFFEQDDFGWLFESRFRTFGEYLRCFFRFSNARAYRPLSQETFFLVFQKLFGLYPQAFHTLSVGCHLTASFLVFRLLRKFLSPAPSLIGALFFAVHSAHSRSVYWISAIPEPMALIFFLLSLISFIRFDREENRRYYFMSVVAMGLGMLSKESILTLPIVLTGYCLIFSRKRLLWTAPHFIYSGFYAVFRALSHSSVDTAPYRLVFGRETLDNLCAYLSWTSGFSESLLKLKLKWDIPAAYPLIALLAVFAAVLLVFLSKDRKIAAFSLFWFAASLQPVLYFHDHIFPYYLAPALPAVSLLLASALDTRDEILRRKFWLLAPLIAGFILWSSYASIKREGRWWNERSYIARDILAAAPDMVRQVPPDRIAILFGCGEVEFGAMQNDAAFLAYGISPYRHIFAGLSPNLRKEIYLLQSNGGLTEYFCFIYSRGVFENWTEDFRKDPFPFLLIQPPYELEKIRENRTGRPGINLETDSREVRAGSELLTIRVSNLDAKSIDLLYTLNGRLMPAVTHWPLDGGGRSTVSVGPSTPRGDYHYRAIRPSNPSQTNGWFPVDVHVNIK